MAETSVNKLRKFFGVRLAILTGILILVTYLLERDIAFLTSTPIEVPFLIKYLVFAVVIGVILVSYDGDEDKRQTSQLLIFTILVGIAIAYFFKSHDKQVLISILEKSYSTR
jgi:Mn2+/Fe2+ NRAMP family transporter